MGWRCAEGCSAPAVLLGPSQPYLLARRRPGLCVPVRLGSEHRREQPEQQTSSLIQPVFKQEHVGLRALPAPSCSSSALGQEPGCV